jgi:hypothetical protein
LAHFAASLRLNFRQNVLALQQQRTKRAWVLGNLRSGWIFYVHYCSALNGKCNVEVIPKIGKNVRVGVSKGGGLPKSATFGRFLLTFSR